MQEKILNKIKEKLKEKNYLELMEFFSEMGMAMKATEKETIAALGKDTFNSYGFDDVFEIMKAMVEANKLLLKELNQKKEKND